MEARDWIECPRRQGRGQVALIVALLVSVIAAGAGAAEPIPPPPAPNSAPPAPGATTPTPGSSAPAPNTPASEPSSQAPAVPPASGPGSPPAQIPPPPTYSPPPESYAPQPYAFPEYRSWGHGYRPDEDRGLFRPLSLTLAIGPGMIIGPGERSVALSYNIFRLGIGIVRNLSFIISYEGAGTDSTNPATGEDSWLSQNQWIFGLQFHFLCWFYVRAGIGPGTVEETTRHFFFSNGTSLTYAGALGVEFLRAEYLALGFEASVSTTHYKDESWQTLGWDLTLAFY